MDTDVDDVLKRGFELAEIATSTDDPRKMEDSIAAALALLKPLASPEHRVPGAAYAVGTLAQHMAMQVLNSRVIEQEERLTVSAQFLAKAAKYFEIAAGMEDYQADAAPARAKEELARLRELGVVEVPR